MRSVLTTGEAARLSGLSAGTIRNYVDSGRLKSYRLPGSGQRRITARDLYEFLRARGLPWPKRRPQPQPQEAP